MPQVKENVENLVKIKKRSALWSKRAAEFKKGASVLRGVRV